jgi:hypothetical protein
MDPDGIFLILLYLCLLILTIGGIIGLSRKVWRSDVSLVIKLFVVGVLIGLLIFALVKFDTVETGEVFISRWEIMIYSASFIIGLNWSINLIRKQAFHRIKVPKYILVSVMTFVFTVSIPTIFYLTANFFDHLNLLGSGG